MKLSLKKVYYPSVETVLENTNVFKIKNVLIFEKKENKGHDYENHIRNELMKAKIEGPTSRKTKNDNDRWGLDADMNIYGQLLNIEVKAEPEAVFGSLSANFSIENGLEGLTVDREDLGPDFYDTLVSILKKPEIEQKITHQLEYIKRIDPSSSGKFSLVMSRAAWDKDREAVTKPLYITGRIPGEIVRNLYSAKGADYIQIGGVGLFYLKTKHNFMPNDLPQFDGTIEFQIRPKAGTHRDPSKIKFSLNIDMKVLSPANMPHSPYTIDSQDGILKLLRAIAQKKGSVKKAGPQKSRVRHSQVG